MKRIYICTDNKTYTYHPELSEAEDVQTVSSVLDADAVVCAVPVGEKMKRQLLAARLINIPISFVEM